MFGFFGKLGSLGIQVKECPLGTTGEALTGGHWEAVGAAGKAGWGGGNPSSWPPNSEINLSWPEHLLPRKT